MSNLQYPAILLGGVQKKFITSLEKQLSWAVEVCFYRTKFQRTSDLKLKHSIFMVRNFLDINLINYLQKCKMNELPALTDNPIFSPMKFMKESPRSNLLSFNFFAASKIMQASIFKRTVCVWNSLPKNLRKLESKPQRFKSKFKEFYHSKMKMDPDLNYDLNWVDFRF